MLFLYMTFNRLNKVRANVIRLSVYSGKLYPQTNSDYDGCFIFYFSFNKSLHAH